MPNFNPASYPIVLKIIDGHLTASSLELGITISRRFSEIRKAEEIGSLYLELISRIDQELGKRTARQERIPEPKKLKDLIPHEDPPVMSIREVALLMRVSADTVRRAVAAGRLPSYPTPGGHRRFSASDVRAFIEKAHT